MQKRQSNYCCSAISKVDVLSIQSLVRIRTPWHHFAALAWLFPFLGLLLLAPWLLSLGFCSPVWLLASWALLPWLVCAAAAESAGFSAGAAGAGAGATGCSA
jgi:hypothetical protein